MAEVLIRVGRDVALDRSAPDEPSLEEYWPDIEGLDHRDALTEEAMPPGTFFDLGIVHLLATATIDRLRELYPEGFAHADDPVILVVNTDLLEPASLRGDLVPSRRFVVYNPTAAPRTVHLVGRRVAGSPLELAARAWHLIDVEEGAP